MSTLEFLNQGCFVTFYMRMLISFDDQKYLLLGRVILAVKAKLVNFVFKCVSQLLNFNLINAAEMTLLDKV